MYTRKLVLQFSQNLYPQLVEIKFYHDDHKIQ